MSTAKIGCLSIPGNELALKELKTTHDRGDLVAFLGAGASAGLYPSWLQLLQTMADEAVGRGMIESSSLKKRFDALKDDPLEQAGEVLKILGRPRFHSFLRSHFGYAEASGAVFTELTAATVAGNFKGIVTTNFDPSVVEARLSIRPEARATGWFNSADQSATSAWLKGAVYSDYQLPILYLHGHFERPETIILTQAEHQKLYSRRDVQMLLQDLFLRQRQLFIGYGFTDKRWQYLVDFVVQPDETNSHFALVPIAGADDYDPIMRDNFRKKYGVEPIFYINSDGRHTQALELVKEITSSAPRGNPRTKKKIELTGPTVSWPHERTDDEAFVGREAQVAKLDRWLCDEAIKLITIVGVGGAGKTSMVGHWLRTSEELKASTKAFVYWSFYHDRDIARMLDSFNVAISSFLGAQYNHHIAVGEKIRFFVENAPKIGGLLVTLDGLEVIQKPAESIHYGELLDATLVRILKHAFLLDAVTVVITSRFPMLDFQSQIGTSAMSLDPGPLKPKEGSALLTKLGIIDPPKFLEETSVSLHGHPLALRILALSFAALGLFSISDSPDKLASLQLKATGALEGKLLRLLAFYDRSISPAQSHLLGVMSFTSSGMDRELLLNLAERIDGQLYTIPDLEAAIDRLTNSGLVIQDFSESSYSVHPIVRDYFRTRKIESAGMAAANILSDAPGSISHGNMGDLTKYIDAISIYVDLEQFVSAFNVYARRLYFGKPFRSKGLPHEGLRATLPFAKDSVAETAKRKLGSATLSALINESAIFSSMCGDCETAFELFSRAEDLDKAEGDLARLAIGRLNHADAAIQRGQLRQALSLCKEAARDLPQLRENDDVLECLNLWKCLSSWHLGYPEKSYRSFKVCKEKSLDRWVVACQCWFSSTLGIEDASLMTLPEAPSRMREKLDATLTSFVRAMEAAQATRKEASNYADFVTQAQQSMVVREGALVSLFVASSLYDQGRLLEAMDHVEISLSHASMRRLPLLQADALFLRAIIKFHICKLDGDTDFSPDSVIEDLQNSSLVAAQCSYKVRQTRLRQWLSLNVNDPFFSQVSTHELKAMSMEQEDVQRATQLELTEEELKEYMFTYGSSLTS